MSDSGDDKTPSRPTEQKGVPLAKLSMPRLARGVARPRLFQVLDEGRKGAAVWIAAPGGAGKTTLAATYLLERKLPYLWYQLDEDDADPATFFYYLGIAAKQAVSDKDIFLPLLTPEYLPDIPGFARRYFRDLYARLPRDTLLVLDNYQDLGEAAIFSEILRNAIEEIPEGTNLLVISRSDPLPGLARHRAMAALAVLDWETLRLTRYETQEIVAHSHVLEENSIHALHQRAEGWPAGVTLILEQIKRKGVEEWNLGPSSLETVFHFFANEFFNDLPETTRDFLLKTALLSHMTPTLAEQVSGNDEAGRILADLHRRHFFTNRRDLEEVSYQYHALFREFLQARAAEGYTREQYLTHTRLAGRLLSEYHRHEEAVALYLQAQDWETAIPLLLSQAPQLLAQGRAQIVASWLQQMPEELVESVPWLLYWKGMSQQFLDPIVARSILEQAYTGFVTENDAMGRMLVASATIDIVYLFRLDAASVLPWIESLQKELKKNPIFQFPAMEARVLTSLVASLMFTRPEDAHLPTYAERLMTLLSSHIDLNQKVFMAGHLIYYSSLIAGDMDLSEQIMMRFMPLLNSPELTIVNQIFWRHMCVLPYLLAGQANVAYEIAHPVLDIVKENNLRFFEYISTFYEVYVHLQMDAEKIAPSISERLTVLLSPEQPMDWAWFRWISAWIALLRGDCATALSHGLAARNDFAKFATPTCEIEIICLIANERCESAKPEEALNYIAEVKNLKYGNTPRLRHQALLIEAYAYLIKGVTPISRPLSTG